MAAGIPLVAQGSLNRIQGHITLASYQVLNVTAQYMSKSMMTIAFEEDFTDQVGTATGVVNSPLPYVMGSVVFNLLRSQSLANAWILQAQTATNVGHVTIYSDSNTFDPIDLYNASIRHIDPGTWDGVDPTVKVTLRGVYPVNASLWTPLTGSAGLLPA